MGVEFMSVQYLIHLTDYDNTVKCYDTLESTIWIPIFFLASTSVFYHSADDNRMVDNLTQNFLFNKYRIPIPLDAMYFSLN